MLLINKGREPASLTAYRKKEFAYFDGCDKADIRKKLLEEQGGLCAYCMRRIRECAMKIEHWFPESKLSEKGKLDYRNMLGVCSGHMAGLEGKYDTCDARKGDTVITIDPRKPEHIQKLAYKSKSGEIYSEDETLDRDLNEALNLNCIQQMLPQNRKAVLDNAIQVIASKNRGDWTVANIEAVRRIYESAAGERKEYAGIVLWYLNRRLKRQGV